MVCKIRNYSKTEYRMKCCVRILYSTIVKKFLSISATAAYECVLRKAIFSIDICVIDIGWWRQFFFLGS